MTNQIRVLARRTVLTHSRESLKQFPTVQANHCPTLNAITATVAAALPSSPDGAR